MKATTVSKQSALAGNPSMSIGQSVGLRVPQIEEQYARLQVAITQIETGAERVLDRIKGICTPEGCCATKDQPPKPPLVPLAEALASLADRAEAVGNRLHDSVGRVEL